MKPKYLFLSMLMALGCQHSFQQKKPEFLAGKWTRLNDTAKKKTYEIWNSDLKGIGYTLKEKDTVFKEILSVVSIQDTLFLKVEGVNEKPTLFKFINQTDSSFVCENSDNEFPKKIQYWKVNDTLKARVWNEGGFELLFDFVKD